MTHASAPQLPAPNRVLIIKPSSLGDVVTALPVLRGLRRTFPACHIAWLIGKAYLPLLEGDDDLNETILFDRARFGRPWHWPMEIGEAARLVGALRGGRFDWVIDLQGLLRSGLLTASTGAAVRAGFADAREGAAIFYNHALAARSAHTVDRNIELARHLGIDARPDDMMLKVAPAAADHVRQLLARQGLADRPFLVVVPPTRWVTKRYPVRHWRAVLAELSRHCLIVLAGGGGAEAQLCASVAEGMGPGVVNLAGQTNIPQMAALIAQSRGVICNDSAAKFIAPAVGVEVVALLGPTRLEHTGPYLRGRALVAGVECQGCLKKKCRHITCMQSIPPADVVAAGLEMLKR